MSKHYVRKTSDKKAAKIVTVSKCQLVYSSFMMHALLNVCPHKGAALCEGPVCGTARETDDRDCGQIRTGDGLLISHKMVMII